MKTENKYKNFEKKKVKMVEKNWKRRGEIKQKKD